MSTTVPGVSAKGKGARQKDDEKFCVIWAIAGIGGSSGFMGEVTSTFAPRRSFRPSSREQRTQGMAGVL